MVTVDGKDFFWGEINRIYFAFEIFLMINHIEFYSVSKCM
jgi:hypothetical protein